MPEASEQLRDVRRSRRWVVTLVLGFAPAATLFYLLTRSDDATLWFGLAYGFVSLFVGGLHAMSRYRFMRSSKGK